MTTSTYGIRGAVKGLAILSAIALASQGAHAEGARLTGDALQQSIAGKTFTGPTSSGKTWEATYAPDGRMDVKVLNSSWTDSGRWEVKDDMLCSERSKRAWRCVQVVRTGDGRFEFIDERRETTVASYAR